MTDAPEAEIRKAEAEMLRTIAASFTRYADATGIAALSPRVARALEAVPRHLFVPDADWRAAYRDAPAPIGYGQTISQPFIVALMTELLRLEPGDTVLEIGTGCGYQTAVLAHLARRVFTIEIVAPLAERAREMFARLGLDNIVTRVGDGRAGWPEAAPFDGILAAAAPQAVPPALVQQLKPGGRLVMPVGMRHQQLILVEMQSDQSTTTRAIIPVSFVPLTEDRQAPDRDADD